jgi:hypothetical protein
MHPEQSIADLAYRLWQARGCPEGTAELDWAEAARQLEKEKAAPVTEAEVDGSLKDTFPASDPPASHLPDEPPVNADAKWAAKAERKAK